MAITQELINELLDNSIENGHDPLGMTPAEVAMDLFLYGPWDEDTVPESPEELIPFVIIWSHDHD